jgi:hypothetical protein
MPREYRGDRRQGGKESEEMGRERVWRIETWERCGK